MIEEPGYKLGLADAVSLWAAVGAVADKAAPDGAEVGGGLEEACNDWTAAWLFPKRDLIKPEAWFSSISTSPLPGLFVLGEGEGVGLKGPVIGPTIGPGL